ncbi:MAG TPA: protein translocase subunit SecD [Nocardioidaceae bacterium]|nr:protein translocase subunit SecD [Nocardioidaceae bacterium]
MATKTPRPGRTLIIFAVVIAAVYGLVALGGVWKPKLGLDLQGGTMITLTAHDTNGQQVTSQKMQEAVSIISQRVNGSGVTEATVGTQGGNNIVVQIPGQNRKNLVDTVKQTAQLRFRLVACASDQPTQQCLPYLSSPGASPSGNLSQSTAGSAGSTKKPAAQPSGAASPRGRALSQGLIRADKPQAGKHKPSPSPSPSTAPSPPPAAPTATPPATTAQGAPLSQPLQWMDNPGTAWLKKFQAFTCPKKGKSLAPGADSPGQPLITCDQRGVKFLLSPALIEGTQLSDASAGIPQNQVSWVVDLSFKSSARDTFANVTKNLAGTGKRFAIVLDGKVISAPSVISPILNGNAQITGNFSQAEAQSLANSLKYGALPLKFTVPVVTEEGPTLASDQLSAGMLAGVVGLLLVMIYCMFYYRGLGLVVLWSLIVAGVITYAAVLILSAAVGFTLTLPGIAGLIVAVGITADSFIVYFERLRDEMRDGKSMRVAVEAGWVRARATCLAADGVSMLAAVVLYIFAIGVVKGFAFTLGISTAIDLLVFFFFTKPLVTKLGQVRFFYSGHKLSGLSPEHIGIERIGARSARTAGGNA